MEAISIEISKGVCEVLAGFGVGSIITFVVTLVSN